MEHFDFARMPFSKGMPGDSLFTTEGQLEILGRLQYIVEWRQFGVVTGGCGCGKTTLLRKLKESADDTAKEVLYLADSNLTPRHFYNGLLAQLGRQGAYFRGDSRRMLHQEIEMGWGLRRRELVVIVDEAHLLGRDTLEEIRFLLNFKMDSVSPLALVLVGQPELDANLGKKTSEAIRQRVDMFCRLEPLSQAETAEYIGHHLRYAGARTDVFSEGAVREVYGYSGGTARLINKACSRCLMCAAQTGAMEVDEDMARLVIDTEFK
jgi:type II secretory pathway predicted ATPase ExeA